MKREFAVRIGAVFTAADIPRLKAHIESLLQELELKQLLLSELEYAEIVATAKKQGLKGQMRFNTHVVGNVILQGCLCSTQPSDQPCPNHTGPCTPENRKKKPVKTRKTSAKKH